MPFVVTAAMDEVPFFLQAYRDGQCIEEILPRSVHDQYDAVDTYGALSQFVLDEAGDLSSAVGSLCILQRPEGPPPEAFAVQHVLDGLPHRAADEPTLEACGPEPSAVLLLGVWFDQILTSLPADPEDEEVASKVGLDGDLYHLHWLVDPVPDLSCEGHPVERVVACRPDAFRCKLPHACGLFIDGRELGRPVCYRSCHSHCLGLEEVLRLVDVEVPEGFVAQLSGGVLDAEAGVFRFADGARVVIWLEPTTRVDSPCSTCSHHDDGGSDTEDADDDADSEEGDVDGHRARSRSPRRHQALPFQRLYRGTGRRHRSAADSTLMGNESLWMQSCCQHACLPCHSADTSVSSPEPVAVSSASPVASMAWTCGWLEDVHVTRGTALDSSDRSVAHGFLDRIGEWLLQKRMLPLQGSLGADVARAPVVIQLSELVDPPCYDLCKQQFPVGRSVEEVFRFINAPPLFLASNLPANIHLHRVVVEGLAAVSVTEHMFPAYIQRVEVYTDGSFDEGMSAWALVVIGWSADRIAMLHWAADCVCVLTVPVTSGLVQLSMALCKLSFLLLP